MKQPTYDRVYDRRQLWSDFSYSHLKGYPTRAERLHMSLRRWREMVAWNHIEIPDDGPWHVDLRRPKSERPIEPLITPDRPADPARTAEWRRQGLQVDTLGRALHPLAELGLTAKFLGGLAHLGMATGPGRCYDYGPNLIGNLLARRIQGNTVEYAVVGTLREGQVVYSCPGGHAKPGENVYDTSYREGEEETGLPRELVRALPSTLYSITPALVGPNTIHSWYDEKFLVVDGADEPRLRNFKLEPEDTGEVVELGWMGVPEIATHKRFMGAHQRMICYVEGV